MDEGGSGDRSSLSKEAAWRRSLEGGGSSFTGDLGMYVKKVSGCGHLSP